MKSAYEMADAKPATVLTKPTKNPIPIKMATISGDQMSAVWRKWIRRSNRDNFWRKYSSFVLSLARQKVNIKKNETREKSKTQRDARRKRTK
jgi:hypothetical protein